ncbi:MAG: galactose-binding protein [Leeuwenhoekiella sp.]|nr:MAG: galactose-binding protein [Leeuwenhoekiella sp.]
MKRIVKYGFTVLGFFTILSIVGCAEDGNHEPLEGGSTPPGAVSNISIENLSGKARLTYTAPADENLLYIVAEYTLENGREMEVKSSYYTNSMLLEGFAGLKEIDVDVYAVNRSEVKSKPVTITVKPEKAAIYDIKESLTAQTDFGGLRIRAQNPDTEDIAILVMQKNEQGDFEPLPNSIYTSASEVDQALRGFDTVSQEFAIAVRDRWLNVTDTLFTTIKPLYEKLMPRSQFVGVNLPNDAEVICCYPVSNLFDGVTLEYWGSYFTSRTIDTEDHLVTWDIGETTKLSRLHIWNFSEPIGGQRLYYYLGAMKHFRIWGANELNDGDLSGWTLLGEYEVVKPSGLPYAQENNDDLVAARDGADYEIPLDAPAVRYLRIQCLENWAGGEFMAVSEVQVFGNPNF